MKYRAAETETSTSRWQDAFTARIVPSRRSASGWHMLASSPHAQKNGIDVAPMTGA